jgi:hypothetical protein
MSLLVDDRDIEDRIARRLKDRREVLRLSRFANDRARLCRYLVVFNEAV